MKVKILVTARYADFSRRGFIKAKQLEAGKEINFPDWYAEWIIKAGLAEPTGKRAEPNEDVTVAHPDDTSKPASGPNVDVSARADKVHVQLDEPEEEVVSEPAKPAPRGRKGRS